MSVFANVRIADSADRRRSLRLAVESGSTLRADRHGAVDVLVSDLSETGCAIEAPLSLAVGTLISIGLVGFGTFEAQVVRQNGGVVGCEFVEPIDAHVVRNAFASTTVSAHPALGTPLVVSDGFPEPVVDKVAIGYRLLFIIGTSALLWMLIAMALF